MMGSWRDLEKWISNEVMGYKIVNPYCHDPRHAFLILRKFRKWSWNLEYNKSTEEFVFTLNGLKKKAEDIPKVISITVYEYLMHTEFRYVPSEYARQKK